tara:strand:+ start:40742 stop:40945 length:204 start_codon:yes stop_codon:yes gene_type:complete
VLILKAKDLFVGLPPVLRALIIVGIAVAIIHPASRQWIFDKLSFLKEIGVAAWPKHGPSRTRCVKAA